MTYIYISVCHKGQVLERFNVPLSIFYDVREQNNTKVDTFYEEKKVIVMVVTLKVIRTILV